MALDEISAVDGGQVYRIQVGEFETVQWELINLPAGDTLSASSFSITSGTSATLVQTDLVSPVVSYRVTGVSVGDTFVDVVLDTAAGDRHKHSVIFKVFQ